MADPFTMLIADGRVAVRPNEHFGLPEIITIDIELLRNTLETRLLSLFLGHARLRNSYTGNNAYVNQQITNDTAAYADYLAGQTYNKLRSILEKKHPAARLARMNTRAPLPANQEFPTWISSTLSCIGPLRIADGPKDRYICYASSAATMANYGRTNPVIFSYGGYSRLHDALRDVGVRMAPFDHSGETGSYYPTIEPHIAQHICRAYGTVHSSHYENEDVVRISFLTSLIGATPFEKVGMRIGYVDEETTLTALAAIAAPPDIPAGQDADSQGVPVGHTFRVNYYGIQPAVAAAGNNLAARRGMYVIGRGMERYYSCSLANDISFSELHQIFQHRVFFTPNPAPQA